MESLNMSWDDILYRRSWINISLLMLDKLHYVGENKGSKKKISNAPPIRIKDPKEATDIFKKLKF